MQTITYNFQPIDTKKPFNPIKTIGPVPSIHATSMIPREIDIGMKCVGTSLTFLEAIGYKAERYVPFILTLQHKSNPISQIFYFTINNQYEDTFKYLGKSQEKDVDKGLFLNTFFEANKGCAKAQCALAEMYLGGQGVERDYSEALKYYSLAAEQEDPKALIFVAGCFSEGTSVDQDQEAAVSIFKYVADNNNYAQAQYQLGIHLAAGLGVEKDIEEAIRYFKLAADQEHGEAIFYLATYYFHSDPIKATKLIQRLVELEFGKTMNLKDFNDWLEGLSDLEPVPFFEAVQLLQLQRKGNSLISSTEISRPEEI